MRKAFSMFVAIATMMIMGALTLFVTSLSGKITKETTDQYRREQAILYAKSYTEFAIMAASANDCAKNFRGYIDGNQTSVRNGQGYRVLINIRHIGTDIACANTIGSTSITHEASQGGVILVDVRVQYRDLDLVDTVLSNGGTTAGLTWRTYRKRSLQRL